MINGHPVGHGLLLLAFLLVISIMTTACVEGTAETPSTTNPSSSSGNSGGIGGSGLFSIGRITGFGSIFVNDIEFFFDTSTTIQLKDQLAAANDLRIGMIVQVRGQFDGNSRRRGTASEIIYNAAIEGPILGPVNSSNDNLQRSFSVLGQQIISDRWRTRFENSSYTALAPGDVVEISGFVDANNMLHASRIARRPPFIADVTLVERDGLISALDTAQKRFTVAGIRIDYSQADLTNLNTGPTNGQAIKVRGTLSSATATLLAARSVSALPSQRGQDGDEAVLEGIITRYTSVADFDINGQTVDASRAELNPPTVILAANTQVKVVGKWQNNRIVASQVKVHKFDVSVFAPVASTNPAAQTLELLPLNGQPTIRIQVTSASQLTDEVNSINPYRVADILPGDFLLVAASDTGAGIPLMAKQVDHVAPKDILIEGIIEASTATSVTVQGVTYPYNANTAFSGISAAALASPTDFQNLIRLGTSIIRIIDKPLADGIADTIEIISP